MEFIVHSHQFADLVLSTSERKPYFDELVGVIHGISDNEIIEHFNYGPASKSISKTINALLKAKLVSLDWQAESPIFQDLLYEDKRWRLDFSKGPLAVEVAFNHGEAIPWNLLKPVLASQLNHVKKASQAEVGVIICATTEMKIAGNFDSAVGDFQKFERYFAPLQNVLNAPILLLGLIAPRSFHIEEVHSGNRSIGSVAMNENY